MIEWRISILDIEGRNGNVFPSQEYHLVGRVDATLSWTKRVELFGNIVRELHCDSIRLYILIGDRLGRDVAGPQIWCTRNCELFRSVSEVETF
jgi:hypothetical protein